MSEFWWRKDKKIDNKVITPHPDYDFYEEKTGGEHAWVSYKGYGDYSSYNGWHQSYKCSKCGKKGWRGTPILSVCNVESGSRNKDPQAFGQLPRWGCTK